LVSATIFSFCGGFALAQQPNDPPCPNNQLAPFGLAPDGHCGATGCLVNFGNYKWWTAFTYNPSGGYYYNGGLGTTFAPEHVSLGADGLHLRMAKDWNQGKEWAGAEAVFMFNADGSQANLGYGDYLVSAKVLSPGGANWNTYDPNVAVGVFNYERYGNPVQCRGGNNNCAREVDLAEISRWGWNHQNPATCPFSGTIGVFDKTTLCKGSAQFALQDFTKAKGMVERYDVQPDTTIMTVTLVMRWRKGQVKFEQYGGRYSLGDLPPADEYGWTTPENLSAFIPDTGAANAPACQRFHINLWLGNYYDTNWGGLPPYAPHAGPTNGQPVEIVIRNFEFRPAP
jgi:hypothetical protein